MKKIAKNKKPLTAKQIIGYIFSVLFIIAFVLVFIAFTSIFIQVAQGKTPTLLGYRFYYILTDSMSPTIEPKQIIISKVIDDYDNIDELVNVGDVITFTTTNDSGELINNTHRVIKDVYYDAELGDYYVQTKGDNPKVGQDLPIKASSIQAVMASKVPAISTVFNAVTSKTGLIFFLGIPFVFILCILIYKLVIIIKSPSKSKNDDKNDLEELKKEIARKAVEEYIESHKDN